MNFELVLSIDYCSCMCYRTLSLKQYSAYLCVIYITSSVIAFYCQNYNFSANMYSRSTILLEAMIDNYPSCNPRCQCNNLKHV